MRSSTRWTRASKSQGVVIRNDKNAQAAIDQAPVKLSAVYQ